MAQVAQQQVVEDFCYLEGSSFKTFDQNGEETWSYELADWKQKLPTHISIDIPKDFQKWLTRGQKRGKIRMTFVLFKKFPKNPVFTFSLPNTYFNKYWHVDIYIKEFAYLLQPYYYYQIDFHYSHTKDVGKNDQL